MSRARLALSLALSLLIGAALLALTAAELDLHELRRFWAGADHAHLALALLAYAGLFSLVHLLRTWRWIYLVRPLGTPTAVTVLRAGAIGFAAIILLPLRLGELVRPYVLSRESDVPMSAAMGTVVVERVMDGLFITGLLFVTLLTYTGDAPTAFASALGWVALAVFGGALAVCTLAAWRRKPTLALIRRLASPLSPRLAERLTALLEAFLDGVAALTRGRALAPFLLLTAAYWTLNGLSIAFLASWGFGLPLGPWAGMTTLAVLVVGLMIPAGPGLAGNYEWFALRGLGLFASAAALSGPGAACVAGMHAAQLLVQLLPGLLLMWLPAGGRPGYRLLALGRAATPPKP